MGDYGLLKIAFENLLGNAWKYTAKSPNAQINIGFCPQQKAFFIQDNGVGFNNENAEGLFEAFQRFHSEKDFAGHLTPNTSYLKPILYQNLLIPNLS